MKITTLIAMNKEINLLYKRYAKDLDYLWEEIDLINNQFKSELHSPAKTQELALKKFGIEAQIMQVEQFCASLAGLLDEL